ncbi:M15 family metallopeptidase [Butyrivibrio fibrisolvens]|uniref:M15 family metallopeptidase n=1 Tax=Butyrivibrio fibrisolvens TaxID=831 RepID=UPI0003B7B071|nr:M15 family metallopeptidase [Butyrivibrio fibrisolvens]
MKSNTSIKSVISMIIVISVLATGCGKGSESVLTDDGNTSESVDTKTYKEAEIEDTTTEKSEYSNNESNEEAGNNTSSEALANNSSDRSVDDAGGEATGNSLVLTDASDSTTDNDDTKGASDNDKIEDTNQNKGDKSDMDSTISSEDFYISEITDELFEKMQGKSYKDDCNVPREDLRYIHILHKNLEGDTCEGEMVCHKIIAQDILEIFEELYLNDYPIERMVLIDEYGADDETSMTANNSSCFNYRVISHTTKISKHGLGIAVDINPLYNPYTKIVDGTRIVEPAAGEPYLDREADFPYKIDEDDLCYKLFIEHGFEWGGSWTRAKDYQHFEMPDFVADELRATYN